jgi:hypothetical protein
MPVRQRKEVEALSWGRLEGPIVSAISETIVERVIDGVGTLRFELRPAGSLTDGGEPRRSDWRAYVLDGKRLVSVTTMLEAILPSPGLIRWAEARGAEGAARLASWGELEDVDPTEAINLVRMHRLGADAARKKGADRGISVHALLQDYFETGALPAVADHALEDQGYVMGFSRWVAETDPEPMPGSIERIVCHPSRGYAGRMDARVLRAGKEIVYDAKSHANGVIYPKAMIQAQMYADADEQCGAKRADGTAVVVFDASGGYHDVPGTATSETVECAVAWYHALAEIRAPLDTRNRKMRVA